MYGSSEQNRLEGSTQSSAWEMLFSRILLVGLVAVSAEAALNSGITGSVTGKAALGPSSISAISWNRLRGGAADLKEKVTGINFKGTLQAGGKNLEVKIL